MNLRRPIVLHPLLLALYSVFGLYAHNIGELTLAEVVPLAGLVVAASFLLLGLVRLSLGDWQRAGLVTTALLLVGLFHGTLDMALDHRLASPLAFLVLLLVLGGLAVWLLGERVRIYNATTVLNIMTLVLLVLPLITVASHGIMFLSQRLATDAQAQQDDSAIPVDSRARKPHVFFLVFDRYAAGRTLRAHYDFDNREIEAYLRSKGFYLAEDSVANYMKTAHSLAATFHMDYINFLREEAGSNSRDWLPTYRLLDNHRVLRTFRALGYRYVHLGSWWEPTRNHARADENYNTESMSELTRTYLEGTVQPFLVQTVLPALGLEPDQADGPVSEFLQVHCARVPYKFARLQELARREEPLLVFAHILIPHPPFLFDADGRCKSERETRELSLQANYVAQVRYANRLIQDLVDTLLAEADEPLIIIQADEGPFPPRYYYQRETDWRQASEEELQIKFRIFNALYLPGVDRARLHDGITPVNTFRLVFDEYFGADLPPLEDKSYAIIDGSNHVYDFFEVTEKVR